MTVIAVIVAIGIKVLVSKIISRLKKTTPNKTFRKIDVIEYCIIALFGGVFLIPFIAFLPAYIFFLRFNKIRNGLIFMAALFWLLYGFYEIKMFYWPTTVIAPIRIDLAAIYPFLIILTIFGNRKYQLMKLNTNNVTK